MSFRAKRGIACVAASRGNATDQPLRGLQGEYGKNVDVTVKLHGSHGRGSSFHEMLGHGMWSHIEHKGGNEYELTEPVEGPSLLDNITSEGISERVAWGGGLG